MRLIDADKLIEKLRDFKEWENDDGRPIHTMSEIQRIDRCINFAQTEPIAHDVDKVIEELEKIRAKRTCNKEKCDTKELCRICVVDDAIEIVKHGGASDDVCEYENTDDEYCKWKINSVFLETINNPHVAERENIETAKYCPCCGKKIKVVE